jgi:hypothetical protein
VLVFVEEIEQQQARGQRFTAARLQGDGRLELGRPWEVVEARGPTKDMDDGDDERRVPMAGCTHDDRYLYRVRQAGKRRQAGACAIERQELFGPGKVTLPLPTSTCPTAMVALGERVLIAAMEPDRPQGGPGRMILGELVPIGAPTRVEWFHRSHLTKPTDFLVGTGRTLVAVDDMIYPKYALVFDLRGPGRPRYRYTAQIEDEQAMSTYDWVHAAASDEALYVRRREAMSAGAGDTVAAVSVLTYAITAEGLIPRALPRHTFFDRERPPRDRSGELLPQPGWPDDMEVLGDRLVFTAGKEGVAHLPISVQGGWRYETARGGHGFGDDEGPTAGYLCDDAKGRWGCRRVDLAKDHPGHVGQVPPFERFSLGGGETVNLKVRRDRGYAVVVHGVPPVQRKELVVLSWDRAARNLRIERRVRLPRAELELVK